MNYRAGLITGQKTKEIPYYAKNFEPPLITPAIFDLWCGIRCLNQLQSFKCAASVVFNV